MVLTVDVMLWIMAEDKLFKTLFCLHRNVLRTLKEVSKILSSW